MFNKILIPLTVLQLFSSVMGSDNAANTKRVVCYYGALTSKQIKNLHPEDIDASLCTHITYLHGDIDIESEEVHITSLFGIQQTGGQNYTEKLEKLKEANPNLKLLLFVSPENMPLVLESAERRTKIIESAIALLNTTKFDGLDFSTNLLRGSLDDFSSFLCEIHAEFEKYGYIVSLISDKLELQSADAVQRFSRCSSFITVFTLENWMTTSNFTRLIAPMNLTETVVNRHIEKGYPANKLLISIPTFGMIVTLSDPKQTAVGAVIDGPGAERTEVTDGYTIFYNTLSRRLNDTTEGWTITRDGVSPYAYSKSGKWLTYEDEISATAKAEYILEKNLGGALFFTLDMDDFDGVSGKTFPIIRAVSDTFKESVRVSEPSL